MPAYDYRRHKYIRAPELSGRSDRHRVIIAGGGPVGLTLALDLAQKGIPSVVLQALDTVSDGSRALCWSKRALEILDRFGVADRFVDKGFTWNRGRVFCGDDEVYSFDLKPEGEQKFPAFVNLQQYYAEEFLLEGIARAGKMIDLRWKHRLVDARQDADCAVATIETPDGRYELRADYLVACDGARSTVRRSLGLSFDGRVFEDHFLIADVDIPKPLPWQERRFWFLPSFHKGETALCHKQGDDMWRVDFQLGWSGVDPKEEVKPEKAIPRIKAMLGVDDLEVTWLSVYTFQCRRLGRFRHGRVIFAGDAAHQVSPFGARGGNSGIQDAENLAWKLAAVLEGKAPERLLDSYDDERCYAADENILHASRTTDFMTAKTPLRARMRQAVLGLARKHPFARALVNSGRLSQATIYDESPLNAASDDFTGGVRPGAPVPNLAISSSGGVRYLQELLGRELAFQALLFRSAKMDESQAADLSALQDLPIPLKIILVGSAKDDRFEHVADPQGHVAKAFDATEDCLYLLRPDQHVAGRWHHPDVAVLKHAISRASGD